MRDKRKVLESAKSITRKYGKYSQAVTMFRHVDGPGFVVIHVRAEKVVEATECLKTINKLHGEPVFSLLPNDGNYIAYN